MALLHMSARLFATEIRQEVPPQALRMGVALSPAFPSSGGVIRNVVRRAA